MKTTPPKNAPGKRRKIHFFVGNWLRAQVDGNSSQLMFSRWDPKNRAVESSDFPASSGMDFFSWGKRNEICEVWGASCNPHMLHGTGIFTYMDGLNLCFFFCRQIEIQLKKKMVNSSNLNASSPNWPIQFP